MLPPLTSASLLLSFVYLHLTRTIHPVLPGHTFLTFLCLPEPVTRRIIIHYYLLACYLSTFREGVDREVVRGYLSLVCIMYLPAPDGRVAHNNLILCDLLFFFLRGEGTR